MSVTISAFERTLSTSREWLAELARLGEFEDERQAYTVLRSVLQSLRDRLTVEEAAHLAAQLPMLVKGMYFDGWAPRKNPVPLRTRESFLETVAAGLGGPDVIDPEHASRAVFALLDRRLTDGEVRHVRDLLPQPIEDLWS